MAAKLDPSKEGSSHWQILASPRYAPVMPGSYLAGNSHWGMKGGKTSQTQWNTSRPQQKEATMCIVCTKLIISQGAVVSSTSDLFSKSQHWDSWLVLWSLIKSSSSSTSFPILSHAFYGCLQVWKFGTVIPNGPTYKLAGVGKYLHIFLIKAIYSAFQLSALAP